MVRWLRHKFREIFCTNNCFIFRETACLTFVKQNLDNENHFFVSSPFALRHTKQQQMVFSFESWRFLYLFFYKFYLNTTVENMSILWIDLTNNKRTSLVSLWHLTGNRCHIWPSCQVSPPLPCHLRPLRVMYDHQMTRDTWPIPRSVSRPPTLSDLKHHRSILDFLNPLRLPSAPDWCMMS